MATDGMQPLNLFTLDDAGQLVPCEDPQAHEAWMAIPANITILSTELKGQGRRVRTVFLGRNMRTDAEPVFYDIVIEHIASRVNVIRDGMFPIIYAQCATIDEAWAQHDRAVAHARRHGL